MRREESFSDARPMSTVDEPAIREGLPLRLADWDEYVASDAQLDFVLTMSQIPRVGRRQLPLGDCWCC